MTNAPTKIITCTDANISKAAGLIREGKLVAFPTETVYGLGADATNSAACAKIFEAKGRPQFNPLITHVTCTQEAQNYVLMNDTALLIAKHFWPGSLTMILPRTQNSSLSDLTAAGLPTSAVRVPKHDIALKLIKESGVPIAAPSANKSGSLSPTSPADVAASLGSNIDLILAGGSCEVGLESTVIDLSGDKPHILRPGAITAEDIEHATGIKVGYHIHVEKGENPKSPGQLLKHYAPETSVRLNAIDIEEDEALLAFGFTRFMSIRTGGHISTLPDTQIRNLSETGDLHEAATNLFRMLRELDRPEHKTIAVMNIPDQGLGLAINDRLRRAAKG